MKAATSADDADLNRETKDPDTDAQARRAFKTHRKSVALAYLLWLLVGWMGIHRVYLGRTRSAAALFLVVLLSIILIPFEIGGLGLIVLALWLLVDAFLIPGMARSYNLALQDWIERETQSGASRELDSGIPPHPGPDDDGVSRVIPKAIWDGPQGDFLREIGMSPDDASNIIPAQTDYQARFEEMRREQEAFLATMNKQMPGTVNLIPWAMLPWSIWQGPHADFLLVTCEKYPVGPWNTMLLPDDEAGAMVLDLPKHLGGFPPDVEAAINRLLGELRENFSQAHARTGAAMAKGDISALDKFEETRRDTSAKVSGIAHFMAAQIYGKEAYDRHRKLFGKALGWGTAG